MDIIRKYVYEMENENVASADEVYVEIIKCNGERGLKWCEIYIV